MMTSPALDGEKEQASRLEFPAATTTLIPLRWIAPTAAFNEALYPPLIDILTTEGCPCSCWCDAIASRPRNTPDVEPLPSEHVSTWTDITVAPRATPYVFPAAVDAQWVPCELSQSPSVTTPRATYPGEHMSPVHPADHKPNALSPKSVWDTRTPVSIT